MNTSEDKPGTDIRISQRTGPLKIRTASSNYKQHYQYQENYPDLFIGGKYETYEGHRSPLLKLKSDKNIYFICI